MLLKTFLLCAGFVSLLLSCASGPAVLKTAPDWVYDPPDDTADAVYFVGSGSDTSGNLAAAEEKAGYSLMAEVTRFIGVKVTAETTVKARETLENYEAEIWESILQESEARLSDFRVIDKWIDQRESEVVLVYLLGEYKKNSLLEEQRRIKSLFEEREDAVTGPEKQGDLLFDRGDYYSAAVQYLDAAAASLASGIENRDIKFIRNMKKARDAVASIQLTRLNDNLDTITGKPFPDGFRLSVTHAAGARIGITHKGLDGRGKTKLSTDSAQPDSSGLVMYSPGVPRYAGPGSITMYLDFRSNLEALEDVPEELRNELESFESLAARKKATFSYRVYSMAKDIPTGVVILDVDMAGNPRKSADTASGVVESLTEAEFIIVPVPDRFHLNGMEDGEIIGKAQLMYGDVMERLIFGVIQIADFDEAEGSFLIKVEGMVKVADLATGRIIASESNSKWSRGSNTVSVISAAFKSIGQELGRGLASKLK